MAKGIRLVLISWIIGGWLTALVAPGAAQAAITPSFGFSVVSVSPIAQLKSGETASVSVVLQNTGTATWTNTGANAVKIGTVAAFDRLSAFDNSSWLSANRVVAAVEPAVAPGQTGQFNFTVTAGGHSGANTEKFGLVMEGVAWAAGSIPLTVNIAPATFAASLTTPASIDLEMKAGEVKNLSTAFTNSGDGVWQNLGASAVKLGTTGPFDRKSAFKTSSWISGNRVATIPTITAGGSAATIDWSVQAPAKIGSYKEEFGLVAEGITWFSPRVVLNIKVVPAVYQVQWVNQSPSVSFSPGDTATVWVDFKNIGNTVWQADGPSPMRLGTARKLDRTSQFYDASWINSNRAATMTPAVVNPGETARFTFTIDAPAKIGKYREYFLPVIENVTWLNDVGLYWDISVDEELTIANLLRVGITSTSDPITISGTRFSVRRGSDKSLVRKFDNQSVTIMPISGGYSLSSGDTVMDTLRIVPINGAILQVQSSGVSSTYNSFRGILAIQRSSIGNVWIVNHIDLEDYMKGIAEVPDSWPAQAQQAQMLAARTYAVTQRADSAPSDIFDLYDDTRSQVYYGYNYEVAKPNLSAAAVATKGLVIKYAGQPIHAYFFSSSGGATEASYNVWGKGNPALSIPYLQGVTDPYDKPAAWSATLTQSYLQQRFDTVVGTTAGGPIKITQINVIERFPSNRAKTVTFTMSDGRVVNVPFYDFDYLTSNNDIKSMNFSVIATGDPASPDFVFSGVGNGHGVGLPQWSAKYMADQGMDFKSILTYFYTGVTIEPL